MFSLRVFSGVIASAAGLAVLAADAAAATQLATGEGISVPWLRLGLGLLLCAMIAFLAIALMKRGMQGGGSVNALIESLMAPGSSAPKRRIQVRETRRVSPQADVCLFECDGREYLVVISPNQIQALRPEDATEKTPVARLEAAE